MRTWKSGVTLNFIPAAQTVFTLLNHNFDPGLSNLWKLDVTLKESSTSRLTSSWIIVIMNIRKKEWLSLTTYESSVSSESFARIPLLLIFHCKHSMAYFWSLFIIIYCLYQAAFSGYINCHEVMITNWIFHYIPNWDLFFIYADTWHHVCTS